MEEGDIAPCSKKEERSAEKKTNLKKRLKKGEKPF